MAQNLSERVDGHKKFQFPSICSKMKKGKKVINCSDIAIQGERVILSQKGEYIYLKVLYYFQHIAQNLLFLFHMLNMCQYRFG